MRNLTTQMEEFSRAYVAAIAAASGCGVSSHSQDRHSVDLSLYGDHDDRPTIDVQVKATAGELSDGDTFAFDLKKKNYEDLRREAGSPRLLVVVVMPKDEGMWLEHTATHLLLRHCGYWHNLGGAPPSANKSSVRLTISKSNAFTVAALREMLTEIVEGKGE